MEELRLVKKHHTNRRVTKDSLMCKSIEEKGLLVPDLNILLKISFVKNMSSAMSRAALLITNTALWNKLSGRVQSKIPQYKLLHGDNIAQFHHLNITWNSSPTKTI